jgi:predicted ATPase
MKMGAVMGLQFKTTELGFLVEQSELDFSTDKKELIRLLDMLVSAEMLQRVPGQRNTLPVYEFKHKYLQDVSYALLPDEVKEKLHYAAAEYYEGGEYYGGEYHGSGGGGKGLVSKLSYHWSQAGDSTHALG